MAINSGKTYFILLLAISILFGGCSVQVTGGIDGPAAPIAGLSQGFEHMAAEIPQDHPVNSVNIKVLVLRNAADENYLNIYQHLVQARTIGTEVTVRDGRDILDIDLSQYHLVYPDRTIIKSENFLRIQQALMDYVFQGGTLFLEHVLKDGFPKDFLGVSRFVDVSGKSLDFEYPAVSPDLRDLQTVWQRFAGDMKRYNGLNPDYHINHKAGAVTDTAKSLVDLGGLSFLTVNSYGQGTVFWANNFLPNTKLFITQLDHQKNEDYQKYVHTAYTTANRLFREGLLKWVSKRKYGFAAMTAYGPYGRPGLSWQNHYEELRSFLIKDMVNWTDILMENNQIPSYSLVRGSYNWGRWQSVITLQPNRGSDAQPVFPGHQANSFFGTGTRLMLDDDYMTFGQYPGYFTLLADIELPERAYPQIVDYDGDGRDDLLVGTADGRVLWLKNDSAGGTPTFRSKQRVSYVTVGKYAAPHVTDFNGDGIFDLLVGDDRGYVSLYLNRSKLSPSFVYRGRLESAGGLIKVSGVSAPLVTDWNGDGIRDLLVGDEQGGITLFAGLEEAKGITFAAGERLEIGGSTTLVEKYAAPTVADWDNNGTPDLLVGSGQGTVTLILQGTDGSLRTEMLQGKEKNFWGSNDLRIGHNSVPLMTDWDGDGRQDLLIGGLEYGPSIPLDSKFFPYQTALKENIRYVQERFIPIYPHIYVNGHYSEELERQELALHKQAFENLGIPWGTDTGANHHTWTVSEDPNQTFRVQQDAGIWWNFGWRPPRVASAPRDGVEFLWVMPYLWMNKIETKPFILHEPAPNMLNLGQAWESMAMFDLPLTYFEHMEHSLKPGSSFRRKLEQEIDFMNGFRERHDYNFMTEEQQARSLITAMYTDVEITVDTQGEVPLSLLITTDNSRVPSNKAKEYLDSFGISVELGERYLGGKLDTDTQVYHRKDDNTLNLGVGKETRVWLEEDEPEDRFHIVRANSPFRWTETENGAIIELTAKGMQNIKFYSPQQLIIEGDDLRVRSRDNYYEVTHFGEQAVISIAPAASR